MGRRVKSNGQLRNRARGKKFLAKRYSNLNSKSEKFFLDIVESVYGIKIERQFLLDQRFFDGRYGEHLLEIDGERWHSLPEHKARDAYKEKIAKKYGFQLHRIRLDSIKGVPEAIETYKPLLEEIFKDECKKL